MKNVASIYLTLLLSVFCLNAQEATICFKVDKVCQAVIYEPIDGAYNHRIPTHELKLTPGKKTCHSVGIDSFGIVYIQFPQYQKTCTVFLFPNDSVQVSINNQGVNLKGSNESGQQFFYDNFTSRPFADTFQRMQAIVQEHTSHKREISSIVPTIYNQLMLPYFQKVEELSESSTIIPAFADVLKKEVTFRFVPFLINFLNTLSQKSDEFNLTTSDSRIIEHQTDSLLHLYPINKEIMAYDSRTFVIRYLEKCGKAKSYFNLTDEKVFGPYKIYLLAPIEMQPDLFGNSCIVQLKYDTGEMDLAGVRRYFNKEFPDHPYTTILNKQIEAISTLSGSNEEDFTPVFVKKDITSLSALAKAQEEFKGKYLFIDLWASWCMPCRKEFNYQKQLHQVLDGFKDIALVYISIDKEQQATAWKNCIGYYKLEGFHLRATSALQENIQKEIYKDELFEIPRYILINPEGEILNGNLPRPSKYPQLKEALEQAMKH